MKNLKSIAKAVAVPVAQAAEQAVEANKEVKKPSIMQAVGQTALEVAKAAVPTALSAIPVAGPILGSLASKLMSTMNDDEWFEEFQSAGATFNEMLKSTAINADGSAYSNPTYSHVANFVGAFAQYQTTVNLGDDVKNNVFPSLLAYVRKRTNNVLVDNVDQYWYAIGASIQLHAIYYNLEKYIKFAHELPLNAPTVNQVLPGASPLTHSQLCGIRDTLRDFLRTSTGLPYALSSYLRWRFGTIFLSENSAKAGLIAYDVYNVYTSNAAYVIRWYNPDSAEDTAANRLVGELTVAITALKNEILAMGRANADIKLAFENHTRKLDVEERHYDEKEFNLRCNQKGAQTVVTTRNGEVRLLLDSRLKVSEAIQAVTLSTPTNTSEPGTIKGGSMYMLGLYGSTAYGVELLPIDDVIIYTIRPQAASNSILAVFANNFQVHSSLEWCCVWMHDAYLTQGGSSKPIISANLSYDVNDNDAVTFENLGLTTYCKQSLTQYAGNIAYRYLAISMQMHYNSVTDVIGVGIPSGTKPGDITFIESNPLSYDIAIITNSQLTAIQRMAIRNLFRGDYTTKREQPKEQVADAVGELVEVATNNATV